MKETTVIAGKPILDFGNDIVITGVLFTGIDDKSFIATLPKKNIDTSDVDVVKPTLEEWHDIFEQQDYNYVKGELNGEKVLLRKSQRNVDGNISWEVFRRDNYACRYCGIDHVPLTVDHIITWETGGATHKDNLLTSCRKCNRTRGNTPYEDFLESDYYKEKSKFLTEKQREDNKKIVGLLGSLPRVKKQRKR